jgi:N-acetyl-anhydromuramyl-L-alanine amidase AmpD
VAFPFIQASHYKPVGGRTVDLVVIHTMEAPEKGTTAESVARYFQTTDRDVSSHYCIDDDSIVQCVREEDVAWCAPGANHNGIHLEHAGYARQTTTEWRDAYTWAMLERSAELTADLCTRYRIPVTWLHPADLLAGKRGITSHSNVSKAFKRSTHWDPGKGFPIEPYLSLVRGFMATGTAAAQSAGVEEEAAPATPRSGATAPEPLQQPPPMLQLGAEGWQVTRLQRLLDARACLPEDAEIDGDFGPVTEAAVKKFQKLAGLDPDGIAGPLTWHALLASTARGRRRRAGRLVSL